MPVEELAEVDPNTETVKKNAIFKKKNEKNETTKNVHILGQAPPPPFFFKATKQQLNNDQ